MDNFYCDYNNGGLRGEKNVPKEELRENPPTPLIGSLGRSVFGRHKAKAIFCLKGVHGTYIDITGNLSRYTLI